MKAIDHFRRMMRERRKYKRASAEHEWRTRAALQYIQMHRKVPAQEWTK